MVYGLHLLLNLYADDVYFSLEKKFQDSYCLKSDFEQENHLRKNYQDSYFFIPKSSSSIDFKAIKEVLPLYEKKLFWIKNEKKNIKTKELNQDIKKLENTFKKLEKEHHEFLLKKKNNFFQEKNSFLLIFKKFLEKYSFLTNMNFPVDHLLMRKKYEKTKNPRIFLERKVYEDGAKIGYLEDSNFRATLSLLFLRLDKKFSYEEKRDFLYILRFLKKISRFHESYFKNAFDLWIKTTEKKINFYQWIKEDFNKSNELHEFITKKQIDLYKYWKTQPFYYKQIFVLENLLLFEVGGINSDFAKKEILKVFFNRIKLDRYKYLDKNTLFYEKLTKYYTDKNIQNEHFLNALFDPGEFSFTLFFFQSSFKFVCMNNKDFKKIRENNISLIKDFLKETKKYGKNLWYYSRVSMYGRMNMESIWDFAKKNFLLVGEEVELEKGEDLYWDKIQDYYLIKRNDKFYLKKSKKYYHWNDPDYFTFFYKK